MKSLPSSFMARCRVFVERAAQEYQITTLLGLTFRNSKWTDYSLTNVHKLYEAVEWDMVLNGVAVLVLLYLVVMAFLNKSGLLSLIFIPAAYFYTVVQVGTHIILLQLLFSSAFRALSGMYNANIPNYITMGLSSLYTPIFHQEGKSPSYIACTRTLMMPTNFFSRQLLNTAKTKSFFWECSKRDIRCYNKSFNIFGLTYTQMWLFPSKFYRPTSFSLKPWQRRGNGFFYAAKLDYSSINTILHSLKLAPLPSIIGDQGSLISSLRWSYRYNLLHRRSMYHSHKLTSSKKLISGGFFDSTATTSNLWFSDQFARPLNFLKPSKNLDSLTLLKSNWALLYSANLKNKRDLKLIFPLYSLEPNASLFNLTAYESSFHFFLKRIQTYSNLHSNSLISRPIRCVESVSNRLSLNSLLSFSDYSVQEFLKSSKHYSDLYSLKFIKPNYSLAIYKDQGIDYFDENDKVLIFSHIEALTRKNLDIAYATTRLNNLIADRVPVFWYKSPVRPLITSSYRAIWQ